MNIDIVKWEMLVLSEQGPEHALTKLVLIKLAQYHKNSGRVFPSEQRLSEELSITPKTVRKHIKLGIEGNWIKRELMGKGGQGWRQYEYNLYYPGWFDSENDDWLQGKREEIAAKREEMGWDDG